METLGDVITWFGDGAHWRGSAGVPTRVLEHLELSAVATVIALLISLPVGVVLGHLGRGGAAVMTLANLGRAIPSFALLVLGLQVWGLGMTPTYVALVVLAVPPILTNTYVGMRGVDEDLRDAARGLGLRPFQMLRRVELPLAVPLAMAGIRTAVVQVVATATLAAFLGEGGLGRYIVDGRATRDTAQLVAGAVLVAALSIIAELGLGAAERALTPRALRRRDRSVATFAEAVAAR